MINTKNRIKPIKKSKKSKSTNEHTINNTVSCSPLSNSDNKYSCLSSEQLLKMAELWNSRHPEYYINSGKPKEIWKTFKIIFSNSCANERCWIKNKLFKVGMNEDFINELNELYAPEAPQSWNINRNTWLSSLDILSVMKQYEDKYVCFRFIGPSPIDFDSRINDKYSASKNNCVWDDLCSFNINEQSLKKKIGIIFNTDPHHKPGEHWVSLFIDIKNTLIIYFDSTGDTYPNEIKKFIERIQKQLKNNNIDEFKVVINKIAHQQKNTECGMYSLYFIIQMLKNGNYKEFTETRNRITDEHMENLRNEYFNIY